MLVTSAQGQNVHHEITVYVLRQLGLEASQLRSPAERSLAPKRWLPLVFNVGTFQASPLPVM